MNLINFQIPKGNICVYPYNEEFLPVLNYAELCTEEWNVTAAVSPRGWGFTGKKLQFRDRIIYVSASLDDAINDIDYILIPEFSDQVKNIKIERQIISQVLPVIKKVKGIILSGRLDSVVLQELVSACNGVCDLTDLNAVQTFDYSNILSDGEEDLKKIDAPIIAVMGMWESTDKFEVSLALRSRFLQDGYSVTQIGSRNYCELMGFHSFPNFMLNSSINETKKVLLFNRYIKHLINEEKPNVIIITVPGSIQQYNSKFTNGFGILPFLVSKAISCDFLIMCAVYATDAKAFFEMLSTSCKYKYGRAIDVIHMSNTMFDTARIKEMEIFRVKHILRDIIAHSIKKDYANSTPPVLDVSTDEGVNKLYEITIKSLSNDTVNTIN